MLNQMTMDENAKVCCFTMEEIIDDFGKEIWYLCLMYVKDRHLAEDVFQIALTKAWQKRFSFRGESSLKTWVMQIAANTCRNMLRTQWFKGMKKSLPEEMLFSTPAADDSERREVRQAVLQLPAKYREMILLYYFQGMKIHEIASALNMKEGTVSTRLKRARDLLGKELKEEMEA